MSSSATYGRIFKQITTGSGAGSYLVPTGCSAIIDAEAVDSGFILSVVNVTIGGNLYQAYDSGGGTRIAVTAFATEGQTINWSFTGTSSKYRILTFENLTRS